MSKTMITQRERRIAASINGCQIIKNKKKRVLESLNTINNIMETERLIKELSEEVQSAGELVVECDKKYSEMAPQINVKKQYLDLVTDEVNHLEEELLPVEQEVSAFEEKVIRQEKLLAERKHLTTQIKQFENETSISRGKIDHHTPLVNRFKEEIPSLKATLSTDSTELTEAEGDVQKLSAEVDVLSERVAAAGDATLLRNSLDKVRVNSDAMQKKINAFTVSLKKNSLEKERYATSIAEKKDLITKKIEAIEDLQKALESLKQSDIAGEDIESLEKNVQEARQSVVETEREIEKGTAELEEHIKHKGGIIEEIDDAQMSRDTAQKEYENIETLVTPYEEHPEKLETLQRKQAELKKSCAEYKNKMSIIEEESQHLIKASDLLEVEHSGYADAMKEIEQLLG